MKKFIAFYFAFLAIITFFSMDRTATTSVEADKVTLYFADRQMMRLVPMDYYINSTDTLGEINTVLAELIKGRDTNSAVRRILPRENDLLSAKYDGETAYININTAYLDFWEKGYDMEQLVVYQIVNSVSSVEGVDRVKFLFDGEVRKDFLHSIDMRDTFVPDYCV